MKLTRVLAVVVAGAELIQAAPLPVTFTQGRGITATSAASHGTTEEALAARGTGLELPVLLQLDARTLLSAAEDAAGVSPKLSTAEMLAKWRAQTVVYREEFDELLKPHITLLEEQANLSRIKSEQQVASKQSWSWSKRGRESRRVLKETDSRLLDLYKDLHASAEKIEESHDELLSRLGAASVLKPQDVHRASQVAEANRHLVGDTHIGHHTQARLDAHMEEALSEPTFKDQSELSGDNAMDQRIENLNVMAHDDDKEYANLPALMKKGPNLTRKDLEAAEQSIQQWWKRVVQSHYKANPEETKESRQLMYRLMKRLDLKSGYLRRLVKEYNAYYLAHKDKPAISSPKSPKSSRE